MERLKEQGKIRSWGVSARHVEDAVAMLERGFPGDFIEVVFNLLRQEAASLCFPLAHRAGVGIIVRVPLEYGVLTGRFTHGTRFPLDDHRHYTLEHRLDSELTRLTTLQRVLGADGKDMTIAALRFCLGFPEVTSIVTGARSPEQIRRNAVASELGALSPRTIQRAQALFARDFDVEVP
jgi:aryl-alcohol dehydrogenase-like predicted oxidoreductase